MKKIKHSTIASAILLATISSAQAAEPVNLSASGDDGNVATNTIDADSTTRWSAQINTNLEN